MTFDEMEAVLPQGFHDSFLIGVSIDYVARKATFLVEVWAGDAASVVYAEREGYRQIRLTFSGLLLCSVDVPDGEYLIEKKPHGLDFDVAYDEESENGWPDEPLPLGSFRRTFYFTQDMTSRVRIAASDVTLEWLTEPRTIY